MTIKEIAEAINGYLVRFERDPELNVKNERNGTRKFWQAGAFASGAWVNVRYVSYQGVTSLRKPDAERYLEWLHAGNVGKHYAALQS